MAEAFFSRRFEARGVPAVVGSAGLAVRELRRRVGGPIPAADGAIDVMSDVGLDISAHLATEATPEHLEGFDIVLAMERAHIREIALRVPSVLDRTFVLKHFVEVGESLPSSSLDPQARLSEVRARVSDPLAVTLRGPDLDVGDPMGGPRAGFLAARREIEEYVARAVDVLLGESKVNDALRSTDPEIADLCEAELERLSTCLQLIPSENFPSVAVMQAQGSVFTVKYAEGYPGRRYYGGYQVIDEMEPVVVDRAKRLFGAEHANVQPHAGAIANMIVYFALLRPGDPVMAMQLDQGGHLTHGSPVNFSGQLYDFVAYGVDPATEFIDMDDVAKKARESRPKMIVAGATAYPRIPDFAAFRDVADEVGALLMVDMAHFAGLVAGGAHPDPVPYADIVTTTTHKSLRGPRGAVILCKERYADVIDRTVIPGIQGGPFMHAVAAKGVCFKEAMRPEFSDYAHQIVRNARALAQGLAAEGFRLVSGGTDTHLILADVRPFGVKGRPAQLALDQAGITCNRNTIPFDTEKPFIGSGLRFGTPAVTTQGMKETEMAHIARLIGRVVRHMAKPGFEEIATSVRDEVGELCAAFPPYPELRR